MMTPTYKLLQNAARAVQKIQQLNDIDIRNILQLVVKALKENTPAILTANRKDLERMDPTNPKYDRLLLTQERLTSILQDMNKVACLDSPLHKTLASHQRPNGMCIQKVTVPFGVVGVIFEARPNVTCDVFSLCFKSGNICVLKGSADARDTNQTIVGIIRDALVAQQVSPDFCILLPADHSAATEMMNAIGIVDLLIPRGGRTLIQYVRQHATVPVIETGAGVCHTYFDQTGDLKKGQAILLNAKTRRVSVCNALDCLIIHEERLTDLPALCQELAKCRVEIYADEKALSALADHYPAQLLQKADCAHYGKEFLDYKMSIRTVSSIDEAIAHIAVYGSKHSECIITEDTESKRRFQCCVDAACVYVNVSTAFTDGGQFGFGAEIGISTQKLHARGPMALPELTTYKYLIEGEGQVRK